MGSGLKLKGNTRHKVNDSENSDSAQKLSFCNIYQNWLENNITLIRKSDSDKNLDTGYVSIGL